MLMRYAALCWSSCTAAPPLYEAIGAYDYARQRELEVIVNKAEYAKLMGFLAQADPDAFVTVYTVHDVLPPKACAGAGKGA